MPIRFTGLDRVFALAAGAHEVSAIRILPSYPAIKPVPDFLKNSTARCAGGLVGAMMLVLVLVGAECSGGDCVCAGRT